MATDPIPQKPPVTPTFKVAVGVGENSPLVLTFDTEQNREHLLKKLGALGPRAGQTVRVCKKGAESKDVQGCLDFDGYIAEYTYLRKL